MSQIYVELLFLFSYFFGAWSIGHFFLLRLGFGASSSPPPPPPPPPPPLTFAAALAVFFVTFGFGPSPPAVDVAFAFAPKSRPPPTPPLPFFLSSPLPPPAVGSLLLAPFPHHLSPWSAASSGVIVASLGGITAPQSPVLDRAGNLALRQTSSAEVPDDGDGAGLVHDACACARVAYSENDGSLPLPRASPKTPRCCCLSVSLSVVAAVVHAVILIILIV